MNKNQKGLFISFEGIDGSGKTTIIELISKKLIQKIKTGSLNFSSIYSTREPGGKDLEFSETIREIIFKNENLDSLTEALLFLAARKEHITKKIVPALEENKIVISDRFCDSTIVYQGIVKGLDLEKLTNLNNWVLDGCFPNITFFLDIDPIIARTRKLNQVNEKNRFDNEKIHFYYEIRNGFKYLANLSENKNRIFVIDVNNKTPEQISNQIFDIILNSTSKLLN